MNKNFTVRDLSLAVYSLPPEPRERVRLTAFRYVDEVVPPSVYNIINWELAKSYAFRVQPLIRVFDDLWLGQGVSEDLPTINTWWDYHLDLMDDGFTASEASALILGNEETKRWSGFRTPECKEGSPTSAHRKVTEGAVDARHPDFTGKKIFEFVSDNLLEFFLVGNLRRLEDPKFARTWCHLDCRPSEKRQVQVVGPGSVTRILKL